MNKVQFSQDGKIYRNSKTGRFEKAGSDAAKVMHTKDASKKKATKEKAKVEAPAETGPVISILSALYGINDVRVEIKENAKVGKKVGNAMAGSDPAPKQKKDLIVKYAIDGVEGEKTFNEGEKLVFA